MYTELEVVWIETVVTSRDLRTFAGKKKSCVTRNLSQTSVAVPLVSYEAVWLG